MLLVFLLSLSGLVLMLGCPPPMPPDHGSVKCYLDGRNVGCGWGMAAEFACDEFYEPVGNTSAACLNGSWTSEPPRCVAECGKGSGAVSLIVNGVAAHPGAFPWSAALYYRVEREYEFWCGGSLVSETAVLTAAHCVWNVSLERLVLVFGKFYREYGKEIVQRIQPRKVRMLASYQDADGNYNGDIAVVFLQRSVVLGPRSAPVCVDWDESLVDAQLAEGVLGTVVGWGLTENETLSDVLRSTRLPVVSDERCIAEQSERFKKFLTYVSFCAGFANGSGVCNGDSGGGLTFFDEDTGRWYLQGLVSVSPRKKGTPFCDPNRYAIFTKVAAFSRWLSTMKREILEGGKGKTRTGFNFLFKKIYGEEFPHSKTMLQLSEIHKKSSAMSERSNLSSATSSTLSPATSSNLSSATSSTLV